MTKRRQVLMDDEELNSIQRLARKERVTTAEWVRKRLREARDRDTTPGTAAKLAAIHAGYRHHPPAPAPEIDQMLDEVERGYLGDEHTS
jgi:hypothetical protein